MTGTEIDAKRALHGLPPIYNTEPRQLTADERKTHRRRGMEGFEPVIANGQLFYRPVNVGTD